jgi:hypothetical protein
MNKLVLVAFLSSLGLTVPGLAPARQTPVEATRDAHHTVRPVQRTTPSWTCARNTYRSVACPS